MGWTLTSEPGPSAWGEEAPRAGRGGPEPSPQPGLLPRCRGLRSGLHEEPPNPRPPAPGSVGAHGRMDALCSPRTPRTRLLVPPDDVSPRHVEHQVTAGHRATTQDQAHSRASLGGLSLPPSSGSRQLLHVRLPLRPHGGRSLQQATSPQRPSCSLQRLPTRGWPSASPVCPHSLSQATLFSSSLVPLPTEPWPCPFCVASPVPSCRLLRCAGPLGTSERAGHGHASGDEAAGAASAKPRDS